MKIHIRQGDIHLTDLRTRMPFKYGIATMTSTPHAFLRLGVEVDGKLLFGIAADSLPPKWFTKDPHRPLDEEVLEMLRVIEHALQIAIGLRAPTPFDAWRQLYDAQARWGREENLPPLLTHFGTSLVERALIEAVCRAAGKPLPEMLRTNGFGIRLDEVHEPLAGHTLEEYLPERPLERIIARQTVGLADPLADHDISSADRVHDGLPQALSTCIRFYGLRHFKIKVSGAIDQDQQRLHRIARVIDEHVTKDYAFTLDGNEQFHSLFAFQTYWEELLRDPDFRRFFGHLLFVEQPFHRDIALDATVLGDLNAWSDRPALIIDESDGELASLPQALQLGYAGTSYKNCKGVFKGIANYCLLARRRRAQPELPALLSGEDLVNVGPVALLQDLTVCATLGLGSVERNGHHYFAGLSMFPREVYRQVMEAHSDLYHLTRKGWPSLTIRDGTIQLDSLLAAPFGVGMNLELDPFTPLDRWRKSLRPREDNQT